MKHTFKPFAARVTSSSQKSKFRVATIRLTAYYVAGITVVLVIFSLLVYGLFVSSIRQAPDHNESFEQFHEEIRYEELTENLGTILTLSDSILFLLSIFVSYYVSRKTLEPIENAYRRQERFVSDAAHELRTPLAVMKAGAEVVLGKERSVKEYQTYISDSLAETHRLIRLSSDLLLLAKQDSVPHFEFKELSLSLLIQHAVESTVPYAEIKAVDIQSSIEPNVFILGDHDGIVRVIVNLLKNAIDYNIPNGSVQVSLVRKGNMSSLVVKDTGIGIEAKDLPHVFERFYRAEKSRASRDNSGLGLSMVKEIIEAHTGSIQIESTSRKGTTVTVTFPCV